jgi:hypothetical protein
MIDGGPVEAISTGAYPVTGEAFSGAVTLTTVEQGHVAGSLEVSLRS